MMPLNKDGRGPEMNPANIVSTKFEVWDATCKTVASFDTKDEANEVSDLLNKGCNYGSR